MELKEIIRLAFLKYRLSGKKSMNTFIFAQAKNNNLTDTQINKIIDTLNKKINEYNNTFKNEWQKVNFTSNLY